MANYLNNNLTAVQRAIDEYEQDDADIIDNDIFCDIERVMSATSQHKQLNLSHEYRAI